MGGVCNGIHNLLFTLFMSVLSLIPSAMCMIGIKLDNATAGWTVSGGKIIT